MSYFDDYPSIYVSAPREPERKSWWLGCTTVLLMLLAGFSLYFMAAILRPAEFWEYALQAAAWTIGTIAISMAVSLYVTASTRGR